MQAYGLNELREMFLRFFESKGHLVVPSYPLIPQNDKSLLLINAGMAPLKPYFSGQEVPPRTRMATCQKCVRTGDIDNVGKTARHGTFFEMLGNFSFGDYFKEEAIAWCWEFLTEVVGLSADRLYPSVYVEDDEAFEIWEKKIDIAPERIFRFGKEDNFWEHGAGPCGPCSEVYYDRGEAYGCGKETCTVGCDCDRYVEIWNNVFTQFEGDGKGGYVPLTNKNIDTGMGLERLACVVQDVPSIFDVDTVRAVRDKVCEVAGTTYGGGLEGSDVSIRVITDHARAATFLISDGVLPSNEGRGYVLRRLIRRACRHARLLGIENEFLSDIAGVVIGMSKGAYPELVERQEFIFRVIRKEEEQFGRTINQGLGLLAEMEEKLLAEGRTCLSGKDAFMLYDTFGFPLDLTVDILRDKGITVDEEGFAAAMQVQKDMARGARKKTNYMGKDASVFDTLDTAASKFIGYDSEACDAGILVLTKIEGEGDDAQEYLTDSLNEGERGTIITGMTPFYATSGGQEADTGTIGTDGGRFLVEDVKKLPGDRIGHVGRVVSGAIENGEEARLVIDRKRRGLLACNHSATHLLQKALREVLGTHVEQKGSLVSEDRLRFDFTHFAPMTAEEIGKVEALVNEKIAEDLAVTTDVLPIEEAKKTGAAALFGEKYGDMVRVVSMGDFSKELCGGTHVPATGQIAQFKILSESGIASGVRRIEAVTSAGAKEYYREMERAALEAGALLKAKPEELAEKIRHLQAEIKALSSENEKLKMKLANAAAGNAADDVIDVKGLKLIASEVPGADMNALRNLGDSLRQKIGEGVVVLASAADGKVSLMAAATDGAQARGAHAGNLIKAIAGLVGGGGGGRPNMAQAGGKDPSGIPAALKKAQEVLMDQIKDA